MFSTELTQLSKSLIKICKLNNIKIATAESCTGGLIAGYLTAIPGSSDIFDRGYTTYSNDSKIEMLNVPANMILSYGAVSRNVAIAMSEGALNNAPVQLTVAVTGVAGPSGGTVKKPVGTVHIACSRMGKATITKCHLFNGNRDQIRESTVKEAINMMLKQI
jgi:nicotinamide-nucleotide amidase